MKPAVKKELEDLCGMGCVLEKCDHSHEVLFFTARCHPGAGIDVSYQGGTGFISVTCHKCKSHIMKVKVAEK